MKKPAVVDTIATRSAGLRRNALHVVLRRLGKEYYFVDKTSASSRRRPAQDAFRRRAAEPGL